MNTLVKSLFNKKLIKISRDNKDDYLWFERDWLLENGWDKKYISNMLNEIADHYQENYG